MSSFEAHQIQENQSLKRRWQDRRLTAIEENHSRSIQTNPTKFLASPSSSLPTFFLGNPCTRINNNNNTGRLRESFRRPSGRGGFNVVIDDDDDVLVSSVVPQVTVVLEGRSICQRISLDKHASYRSLANALRQMFVDGGGNGNGDGDGDSDNNNNNNDFDLSNAIPGHLIAYEDMENDLLLVGDLKWK